jgi:hypothetical protein
MRVSCKLSEFVGGLGQIHGSIYCKEGRENLETSVVIMCGNAMVSTAMDIVAQAGRQSTAGSKIDETLIKGYMPN